jgi:hypothetical protein
LLSENIQATVLEESETGNENDNWYTPTVQAKKQDDDAILVEADETKPSPNEVVATDASSLKTAVAQNPTTAANAPAQKSKVTEVSDEYEDFENYEDSSLTLDAESYHVQDEDAVIHCRRYDVYICYDNYYRTPRVYLFGYDDTSSHHPLSPDRIMEDIIQDYINKTVTIEPHPHYAASTPTASIHPCQHANAMKRIIDEMMSQSAEEALAGNEKPAHPTVDQYLFIFLKFLQSVIPTIEYDYTIDVQIKGRG